MKKLIFLTLLFASNAWPAHLLLEGFDQLKLASVLEKLDPEFRDKIYEPRVVKTIFPKNGQDSAFLISCRSEYYNESPYPSGTSCGINIDVNHKDLARGHDVLRGTFKNQDWIRPLSESILYGRPRKEMYSAGRDSGIRFDGKEGIVFHYRFSCSPDDCIIDFSEKILTE